MTFFHVEFSSPEETANKWLQVFRGEAPGLKLHGGLNFGSEYFQIHELGEEYPPDSISLVSSNLVAHWKGRISIADIRDQAKLADEKLAHLELLSLFGVCPELMLKQNGKNLPYFIMAGADGPTEEPLRDCRNYPFCLRFNRDSLRPHQRLALERQGVTMRHHAPYDGECSAPTITRCQD